MSNNKQSMKLYTEEEIKRGLDNPVSFDMTTDEFISSLSPIELPSDEEIDNHIKDDFLNSKEVHKYSEESQLLIKAMCKAGALWMRDLIQGGNNE